MALSAVVWLVRWKPDNYLKLSDDDMTWNLVATNTMHYILEMMSDAVIFPWKNDSANSTNIPTLDLTPDNLLQHITPKVTSVESM